MRLDNFGNVSINRKAQCEKQIQFYKSILKRIGNDVILVIKYAKFRKSIGANKWLEHWWGRA